MTDETTYDPSEPPEDDPTAPVDPGEDPPEPEEAPEGELEGGDPSNPVDE